MRSNLEYNFRRVEKVEMTNLLDSIDHQLEMNMESTWNSYNTYDEVSNETYNDYRVALAKIEILEEIGLITPTECKDIMEEANAMRLKFLNNHTSKKEEK